MNDSYFLCRRDVLRLFELWRDDLNWQIEESIKYPHTRSNLKVCRTQLEDCICAIKEFPAADGVGKRLKKLEQLEKLLPVVPGDVVYETDGVRVYRRTVRRIVFDCGPFAFDDDAIANGNVFLTEREAEQATGEFGKADEQ